MFFLKAGITMDIPTLFFYVYTPPLIFRVVTKDAHILP